jgi:hypothetical protein
VTTRGFCKFLDLECLNIVEPNSGAVSEKEGTNLTKKGSAI